MFRIDDPSAAITLPTPEAAGAEGYWTEGNPVTNTPATLERASWFNMVQEELRNIVLAGGGVPSKTTYNQVLLSIENLIEVRAGNYVLDTGVANAYVIALNPAIAAYTNGMVVRARVANANTGASTLNAGGGVVPLVNDVGSPLASGDLPAGSVFAAAYDSALNKFLITSLVPSQAITQAQADARYTPIAFSQFGTGISGNVALTAAQSGQTFEISAGIATLPAAAVGLRYRFIGIGASTGTITSSGAAAIYYPDTTTTAAGASSPVIDLYTTYEVYCDGGNWLVNTSRLSKSATLPNQPVNLGQAIPIRTPNVTPVPTTSAVGITASHSLGVTPVIAILEYICLVAEQNYNVGDVQQVIVQWNGTGQGGINIWKNATQVGAQPVSGYTFSLTNKTTGANFTPTAANWASRFVLR
ncbi:MAG: hypothetical protein HKM00_02970 [Gallionella sp.]|nr:hypothetical protein [Gallionella sp.]